MKHVDAVTVLFDHPLNTANLTSYTFSSSEQLIPELIVHDYTYTR